MNDKEKHGPGKWASRLINTMMDAPVNDEHDNRPGQTCAFCSSDELCVGRPDNMYQMICESCGASGPRSYDIRGAYRLYSLWESSYSIRALAVGQVRKIGKRYMEITMVDRHEHRVTLDDGEVLRTMPAWEYWNKVERR